MKKFKSIFPKSFLKGAEEDFKNNPPKLIIVGRKSKKNEIRRIVMDTLIKKWWS